MFIKSTNSIHHRRVNTFPFRGRDLKFDFGGADFREYYARHYAGLLRALMTGDTIKQPRPRDDTSAGFSLCDVLNEINRFAVVIRLNWTAWLPKCAVAMYATCKSWFSRHSSYTLNVIPRDEPT